MLNEAEARRLLASLVPLDASWGAHSVAVAEIAGRLATELANVGIPVDFGVTRAGGLLHDVGRSCTHDLNGHAWAGYELLIQHGHSALAQFCLVHHHGGLTSAEARSIGWPQADYRPATWEQKVVTIADGLTTHDRVVGLAARCADARMRYRDRVDPTTYRLIVGVEPKIRALMREVERHIGWPLDSQYGAVTNAVTPGPLTDARMAL